MRAWVGEGVVGLEVETRRGDGLIIFYILAPGSQLVASTLVHILINIFYMASQQMAGMAVIVEIYILPLSFYIWFCNQHGCGQVLVS